MEQIVICLSPVRHYRRTIKSTWLEFGTRQLGHGQGKPGQGVPGPTFCRPYSPMHGSCPKEPPAIVQDGRLLVHHPRYLNLLCSSTLRYSFTISSRSLFTNYSTVHFSFCHTFSNIFFQGDLGWVTLRRVCQREPLNISETTAIIEKKNQLEFFLKRYKSSQVLNIQNIFFSIF